MDGLFLGLLREKLPPPADDRAGNAPMVVPDPAAALQADMRGAGLRDIKLWSYSYASAFDSPEEAWEWEVVRHSPFRMRAHEFAAADVAALQYAYCSQASALLAEHGVLAMGTGAMFGVASKP